MDNKDKVLLISYNVELEKAVKNKLKPKYMNDVFTWKQIKTAIEESFIKVFKEKVL